MSFSIADNPKFYAESGYSGMHIPIDESARANVSNDGTFASRRYSYGVGECVSYIGTGNPTIREGGILSQGYPFIYWEKNQFLEKKLFNWKV